MSVVEQTRFERLPLLDLDPDLVHDLAPADRADAASLLLAPVGSIPEGPWRPPRREPEGGALGLLVIEGELIRELDVDGGHSVELLGHGDLLRPWQEDACSFCVPRWRVLTPVRVAVLDNEFRQALAGWPALLTTLIDRAMRRSRFLAFEAAVSNQIGLEGRLLAMMWQLAEKWGRLEEGNVHLSVRLTHRLLADLVGARRPSVTQALGTLVSRGEIEQREDGCWTLTGEPPA